jgi:hypothetical protein
MDNFLTIHEKNKHREKIVVVGKTTIRGKRLGGSHDAVFGLGVGPLALDKATSLASANDKALFCLLRGVVLLIVVIGNRRSTKTLDEGLGGASLTAL